MPKRTHLAALFAAIDILDSPACAANTRRTSFVITDDAKSLEIVPRIRFQQAARIFRTHVDI